MKTRMRQMFTAEYLNGLPGQKRAEAIDAYVDRVVSKILEAAEQGKTGFLYDETNYTYFTQGWASRSVKPTMEELALAFRDRFPDSKIELQEFWVDVRPGLRQQRCQITIDWTPSGKARDIGLLTTNAVAAQVIRL